MVYPRDVRLNLYVRFEVDSTESIWYMRVAENPNFAPVLKLTPQSQYGIGQRARVVSA